MGKYLINGSKYEIDESIQGEELTKTLEQLANQPAADPRAAKIDQFLSETDALLKLTPGTSARQIYQESRFKDDAVSRAGARGLAQVMPVTAATLSKRLGRGLDPHNTDDALLMHREIMKENLAKFGNEADALRAYNAGWDKKRWANPETEDYIAKVTGGKSKPAAGVPYAKVKKDIDPAKLAQDPDWVRASKQFYNLRNRQQFQGTDEEAAEWGKEAMGFFNSNMVQMARYGNDVASNGTQEDKDAFLYLMDSYDNTNFSWEGAGRAALGMVTDPTNLVSVGSLGLATLGKEAASVAAKQGIKKALMTAAGRTGVVAGIDGAILGAADNTIRQSVEVSAGRKDSIDMGELAGKTALGAGAGVVLGTAGDAAIQGISKAVGRVMPKKAPSGPVAPPAGATPGTPSPTVPGAPVGAPSLVPGAPAGSVRIDPELVPKTILAESEIVEATKRAQKGRLWVDDLAPVTPANDAARLDIDVPYANTGLRSTPMSMESLTEKGEYIAGQLRELDDKTMHGVLESFRQGELALEESRIVARGIQIHSDELRVEEASLIKGLGLSTNAQETTKMVQRLEEIQGRLVPLQLADDAFGSMAGSMLRQRQEGLPGLNGVSIESLMAEKNIPREEAEQLFVRLVEGAKTDAESAKVAAKYDADIDEALKQGDAATAAMLTAQKTAELGGKAAVKMPDSASFMDKAKEFVISNVFTPTTVLINLVPAAAKTLVIPAARAVVTNPLERATRRQLVASYSAMVSTSGAALRAARAAFKYEQSLLTRGTGRLMEGELAMTGKAAGWIRFFPRVLNATDEFLGQINYASFVAGQAAATATEEAIEKGAKGRLFDDYVKNAVEISLKDAFKQPSGEALIQPLVNKGVNMGLTGGELFAYVRREAAKDPEALRHGANEAGLDFVRDVLYKRGFSGNGTASSLAKSTESIVNKHPGISLVVGQLFFRTPIRVFEEGIRLTPGLQILAPKFLSDLRGANGHLPQVRAQAEAMTSLAITGAVLTLYASGKITGDGAYENWKAQRTRTDGSAPPPYTITMADGSTWSYRNFDPVATPFKIIINGLERMDRLAIRQSQGEFIDRTAWDQAQAYITVGTSAVAAALRDANLVAGLDQALKFMTNLGDPEGKEDAWVKMFGEKIGLLVPNTMHKIAKQNDPTLKDPADFWQVVETRLAALHIDREEIKTSYSYDVLGNVRTLADTGTLWNIFSVATADERARGMSEQAQTVMLELDRLQRETGVVFTPPIKHKQTGEFDLRTTLTADGKETLYDRWQRNYRDLQPDAILAPILAAEMPDGTFKYKAIRVETVQKVMGQLRDAAFMRMMAEEQVVIDRVIKNQINKASAQSGLLDFSNRDK